MDLNDLFYQHQVSLMRAHRATCVDAKLVHEELAHRYARLIEHDRHDRPRRGRSPARLMTSAIRPVNDA